MQHLKILRLKAKIKYAKTAARKLGISYSMMTQMEQGIKRPSSDLAVEIAKLYNCSLEDIFLPYNSTDSEKSTA
jgi:putative transcriptional regulator